MPSCAKCPWNGGRGTVRSPERRATSGIAIIGEGPWKEEVLERKCFVGPSGIELGKTLMRAGLGRGEVAIENAFACWKPGNATANQEVEAVEACRERMSEFLEEVKPKGLLVVGGRAMRSIAPGFVAGAYSDGLMRHRGSLWRMEEVRAASRSTPSWSMPESVRFVMTTIHPAAIIRRERLEKFPAMGYRGVPAIDLRRLMTAMEKGRSLLPIESRVGLPPLSELSRGFVFDLETNRTSRFPELVGVQAVEGGVVWQAGWSEATHKWMEEAMSSPVLKVGHNIHGFDLHVLADIGIAPKEPFADTMAAAGMCEPDMARGLYFQQAFYFGHRRPFHKELSGANLNNRDEVAAQTNLRRAWRETGLAPSAAWGNADYGWDAFYNALDVDSTRVIYNEQMDRARKEGWA